MGDYSLLCQYCPEGHFFFNSLVIEDLKGFQNGLLVIDKVMFSKLRLFEKALMNLKTYLLVEWG